MEVELKMVAEKKKIPTWNPEFIRDLSERVYRRQLGSDDTRRMIEKDKDNGEKLRNRAAAYDQLSRAYLELLGFTPPAE
jgi:hypothetical protein